MAGGIGSGGSPGMTAACTNDTTVRTGHATWYTPTGAYPACGIAYASLPKYYGAMNEDDYRGSAACGTCARVQAQGKSLDIEIGDLCPYVGNEKWCYPGSHHIDLSPDAFAFFANPMMGVLDIQWKYIPCPVTGGVAYTFKKESTQYWAEVLVSNYPYEITKLEFVNKQGAYQSVPRMSYNYFQAASGMGAGPIKIRVTDIHGSTVEDSVPLMPGGTYHAPDNFGLCKM
jgi:expansin (peptidoglycan-binding protein)